MKSSDAKVILRLEKLFDDLERLSKQSHSGLVLWSTAFLEQTLESVLRSHMPNLDNKSSKALFERGPLSSMYAKTEFAYAMGLITKEHHDTLSRIRSIRNLFAHSSDPHLHCDHPTVVDRIKELRGTELSEAAPAMHFLNVATNCASELSDIHSRALERNGLRPILRNLLGAVGVPDPGAPANEEPHQHSKE